MDKIKSGIKTSEFWLAVLGAIITVLNQQLGLNIPAEALLGVLGTIATYIIGRSVVKKNSGHSRVTAMLIAIMISLLLIMGIFGCAGTSWKGNATASYEATGTILTEIQSNAKEVCDRGMISQADCEKLKDTYNKTRTAYITAGDMLIVAINTEDASVRQKSVDAYTKALSEMSTLIPELIRTATEIGIIGGAK